MSHFALEETIVAVSTPPGRGAISVLRLSGSRALEIALTVFKPRVEKAAILPRRATLGQLLTSDNKTLDEVIATYFPAPRSFTGEHVVEISCHGSPVLLGAALDHLVRLGARLAQPGEFSMRALINGKMDLAQTEGLRDLIDAQTRRQADVARRQMEGSLSIRLAPLKERIVETVVHLETAVEFVEDQATPQDRLILGQELSDIAAELKRLSASYEQGRLIHDGWTVAIAGRPNVGKSSIFNKIVEYDRAIVTAVPGTTRDPLRETIDLQGIPVTIVDTAGLRQPKGVIEKEGIRRSHSELADAHVVLFVLDSARGWTTGDRNIWKRLAGRRVVVIWNKMDLLKESVEGSEIAALRGFPVCRISATTGQGMEKLRQILIQCALPDELSDEDLLISNARHRDCLDRTADSIKAAVDALARGLSEEFALADLATALSALGEITGETAIEDILHRIFSQFCIGK
jgi:tRNA modification GTPase